MVKVNDSDEVNENDNEVKGVDDVEGWCSPHPRPGAGGRFTAVGGFPANTVTVVLASHASRA